MPRPPYRLIDHTADIAFEVTGEDWPGLLAAATAAMGDVIRAAEDEATPEERAFEVSGEDREDLLVACLTEAVVLFEEDGFLARDARFERAGESRLRGAFRGRRLDPEREPADRVVKAVTYHDLRVREGGDGEPWRATVVLDL